MSDISTQDPGASAPSGAGAPARAAGGPAPDVPVRADGLELLGEMTGSGYRVPPSLVRRADGQTVQLTRLLHLVLAAVDGHRDHAEIAEEVSSQYGRRLAAQDVHTLIESRLRPLGLLRGADGSQPTAPRSNPLLALRFRYVVSDPEVTRRITAPFAVLFHPVVVAAVLMAFVAVTVWVLAEKGLASATHQAFDEPLLLLAVFGLTVVSAGFHEFGHAAAARYGGATPGAMGTGLYLVWPAFYTDVTDSYRLGRAGRVRTDLGGLYFNAIVAVAIFGVWAATGWDALLLIIATQVLQMVRQLAPFVRFDGYHVLADLTGVPDLFHRIGPTLRSLLPWRRDEPLAADLKPWARAVVTTWVLVVVPLLLVCLALMVLALPRILGTAWAGLDRQWDMLLAQYAAGDLAAVLVRVLSLLAIALPVLGIVYILVRLARQVGTALWGWAQRSRGRRVAATAALLALTTGIAAAWWPVPERYEPIRSYERGTITDALPVSDGTLAEGRRARAAVAWPQGAELPTRDEPQLAVVLVPRAGAAGEGTSGEAPSTWVFPFDRPAPPAEDGNQALAVNTTDGSTLYDVAFALVWATDGEVTERNEAYALASCTGCTTVAVAFQVVLVVGQTDVIVPENLSAAVNYSCLACVTYALATQLVVTLDEALSEESMAEIAALAEEVAAFATQIEDVPLSEIQGRLTEFEQRILDVIERDTATTEEESDPAAEPSPSPSAEVGTGSGAATEDETSDTGAGPGSGATEGPADEGSEDGASQAPSAGDETGTGTGTTAEESGDPAPSPTPTPEPSPTATAAP